MKLTNLSLLLVACLTTAGGMLILAWNSYGSLPAVSPIFSVGLWIIALYCGVQGWIIRQKISQNMVGPFSEHLDATFIARNVALAKACEWVGAIVLGLYLGLLIYDLMQLNTLQVARDEVWSVVAGGLASGATLVAGRWLERSCLTPPQQSAGTPRGEI